MATEENSPPILKTRITDLMRGPFDIRSLALTGLFVLAIVYTLYFTRSVLLPFVLALLLSYLLAPLVRGLARCKIPPLFGSALVLTALLIIGSLFTVRLATPASGWIEKLPYSFQRLHQKMLPLKRPIQKVTEASAQIEKITAAEGNQAPKTVVEVKRSRLSEVLFSQTPDLIAQAVMMLILLYFLLAYDQLFLTKLVRVIPKLEDKKRAITIAREIEDSISKYLITVTLINLSLGCVLGVTLYLLGMPNPVLWGAIAAAFNFVPYLGATAGIVALTLGAVLSFDDLGWALVFPASYLTISILEGNFITPIILGRSLTLNPIVIVLALMFWGWMWGIAGAILAVPMLATFKIFCDHVEPLAPVSEFLTT